MLINTVRIPISYQLSSLAIHRDNCIRKMRGQQEMYNVQTGKYHKQDNINIYPTQRRSALQRITVQGSQVHESTKCVSTKGEREGRMINNWNWLSIRQGCFSLIQVLALQILSICQFNIISRRCLYRSWICPISVCYECLVNQLQQKCWEDLDQECEMTISTGPSSSLS